RDSGGVRPAISSLPDAYEFRNYPARGERRGWHRWIDQSGRGIPETPDADDAACIRRSRFLRARSVRQTESWSRAADSHAFGVLAGQAVGEEWAEFGRAPESDSSRRH